MKTVQDKDGNIIEVPNSTLCHPGIDGALPIMLDEIIDSAIFADLAEREALWEAGAIMRNALSKITQLEGQITPRRIREAILGIDNGWLMNVNSLIATERAKLT